MTRCTCLVPGCDHWTSKWDPAAEWICAEHWRLVPQHLKRVRKSLTEKYIALGEMEQRSSNWMICHSERSMHVLSNIWRKMRRAAIEGSDGL